MPSASPWKRPEASTATRQGAKRKNAKGTSVKKMRRTPTASWPRKAFMSPAVKLLESSVNIVTEMGMAKSEKGSTYQTRA